MIFDFSFTRVLPFSIHGTEQSAGISRFSESLYQRNSFSFLFFSFHSIPFFSVLLLSFSHFQKRMRIYVERMRRDKIIDDDTKRFLIQTDPKSGRFYILPKVHKQGTPGRPIVSSNSHPTERISQFVDFHLKPLVQTTQSFIKDTTHFLNKLEQIGQLPDNAFLVTFDFSSLYTNIPHNEGIDACWHVLDTHIRNGLL